MKHSSRYWIFVRFSQGQTPQTRLPVRSIWPATPKSSAIGDIGWRSITVCQALRARQPQWSSATLQEAPRRSESAGRDHAPQSLSARHRRTIRNLGVTVSRADRAPWPRPCPRHRPGDNAISAPEFERHTRGISSKAGGAEKFFQVTDFRAACSRRTWSRARSPCIWDRAVSVRNSPGNSDCPSPQQAISCPTTSCLVSNFIDGVFALRRTLTGPAQWSESTFLPRRTTRRRSASRPRIFKRI